MPTLKLGNSSDIETGEWVVAIGSPLSLTNSVTAGVVSSPNRQGRELGVHNPNIHYIQTDAAITVSFNTLLMLVLLLILFSPSVWKFWWASCKLRWRSNRNKCNEGYSWNIICLTY